MASRRLVKGILTAENPSWSCLKPSKLQTRAERAIHRESQKTACRAPARNLTIDAICKRQRCSNQWDDSCVWVANSQTTVGTRILLKAVGSLIEDGQWSAHGRLVTNPNFLSPATTRNDQNRAVPAGRSEERPLETREGIRLETPGREEGQRLLSRQYQAITPA